MILFALRFASRSALTLPRPLFLAALLAAGTHGAAAGEGDASRWVRPSGPGSPLIWGRAEGILFGLPSPGGMRGPRGLVRAGILQAGRTAPDLINFIAFEPVVRGKKGFSELERSRLDGVPGKRLAVTGPVEGRLEEVPGPVPGAPAVEALAVTVECERFENGAHVLAELSVRSDRPGELRIQLRAAEGSEAMEECTVTATMGNYGRLRRLALRDRWVDSREIYESYSGDGFAEGPAFPLEALLRSPEGDAMAAMLSDEADPAAVAIERASWWQYRSVPLTQYWRVPAADVRPELRVRANGRRVYWRSKQEIPGGIAFENFEVRMGFAPGQSFIFGLSRRSPAENGMAPRVHVPVIYCTDLYHPHEDADDHFDIATLLAIEELDVKAVILDQAAHSQDERPGRIPLAQLRAITGRELPSAAGLKRPLRTPQDEALEQEPGCQAGVELLLKVLRESRERVAIAAVGSLRDVAAALNREPELFRERAGKILAFAGDAAEEHSSEEYNVRLDPCAFARVLRSGLDVHWVPCFDGGPPRNLGRGSVWRAGRKSLLEDCSPQVLAYFLYSLRKRDGDPIVFLNAPVSPEERAWLLSGEKDLFCTVIFTSLSGRKTVRDGKRGVALPPDQAAGLEERKVFGFAPVDVTVTDGGKVTYGPSPESRRVMRFEVLDREHYAEAMTSMTAALLSSLGRDGARAR